MGNIRVGIQYIEAWLGGLGCVPLYNLMEDAATAEISRTQVWQWVHHPRGVLADGRKVTLPLVRQLIAEEAFAGRAFFTSCYSFDQLIASDTLDEFLTLLP